VSEQYRFQNARCNNKSNTKYFFGKLQCPSPTAQEITLTRILGGFTLKPQEHSTYCESVYQYKSQYLENVLINNAHRHTENRCMEFNTKVITGSHEQRHTP
jgi:hypothetical protein